MIAAIQTQTETFQVGDYIAPTWSAGADNRGVIVQVFSRGKRTVEWWAKVRWLSGRNPGTAGTIAWRQLRLVWRPVVGATVKLQGDRRQAQQCAITKIHDTGELQLQPKSGHSFKAGLDAIAISEEPDTPTEPEDDEAEAWAIAQVSALQAGAYVVSLVPVLGCDRHAIFTIGMIDDDGAWLELVGDPEEGFDPVPLAHLRLATEAEIAALKTDEKPPSKLPTRITEVNSVAIYQGAAYYSEPKQGAWRLASDEEIAALEKGDRVSAVELPWVYKFVKLGAIDGSPAAICAFVDHPCFHYRIAVGQLQVPGVSSQQLGVSAQESEVENCYADDDQKPSFEVGDRCYYVVETNTAQIVELRDGEVRLKLDHGKNPEGTSWLSLSDCYPLTDAHVKDIHLLEPGTAIKGETLTGKACEGVFKCLTASGMVMIDQANSKPMMLVPGTVVLTQNSKLRGWESEVGRQEPALDPYEYVPIDPTPVWFSPNGDPANLVEGQAIARNGKGNIRLVWGEGREADVPGQKVQWSRPELTLAAGFQSVPLSLLTIDPEIQPRVLMDEPAIAEYQEAMAEGTWDWAKDPIVAYWDGTTLWLSSGGHRCEGARRAGLQYISLEVRLGDRSEALLNAPCANMQHGVRMSGADKNRAIALILRDPKWQQESSRSLARMLTERGFRVDHKKIEGIRKGLAASGENPQIEQRIVRRGNQTYTTAAPAVRQDQHSLEEVKALYAELGEFSVNGDPTRPYKFECMGVLQRFKSLDEAYEKFAWMRERVAEKQKEYRTTCVDCAKRVNLKEGAEFECSALGNTHAVTDDPGASGCRHYRKKSWAADPVQSSGSPAAFTPFNPAIERPEPPTGAIVTGYSAKDGEEDLRLTGSVVEADGDRLRLENGGMVYRDSALVEVDPEQEQAAARDDWKQSLIMQRVRLERLSARDGLKQAIAAWAAAEHQGGFDDDVLEGALSLVLSALANFEF